VFLTVKQSCHGVMPVCRQSPARQLISGYFLKSDLHHHAEWSRYVVFATPSQTRRDAADTRPAVFVRAGPSLTHLGGWDSRGLYPFRGGNG
jgi:hypothetical protein